MQTFAFIIRLAFTCLLLYFVIVVLWPFTYTVFYLTQGPVLVVMQFIEALLVLVLLVMGGDANTKIHQRPLLGALSAV
jgi:hypothetical protein